MLQLKNQTPFLADFALFPNAQGRDTLYVMLKATFSLGSQWTIAAKQIPLSQADEYWGEPGQSSLKAAGEYHIEKPATDVLMYGLACSPGLKPLRQMDVGFSVGPIAKTARIFGNRSWQNQQISQPSPFVNMPLVYERAFGGAHHQGDQVLAVESRNPAGKGFIDKRSSAVVEGLALPNIESPAQLIRHWQDRPEPIGFGPIAPNWPPRASLGGTYDQAWREQQAPYLPEDFDPRFLNVAPVDQIYPGYLMGGEQVQILGMHRDGDFAFAIPYVGLSTTVLCAGQLLSVEFNMETLALYPNQKQIAMTWRAAVPCSKGVLSIEQITVSLRR